MNVVLSVDAHCWSAAGYWQ